MLSPTMPVTPRFESYEALPKQNETRRIVAQSTSVLGPVSQNDTTSGVPTS